MLLIVAPIVISAVIDTPGSGKGLSNDVVGVANGLAAIGVAVAVGVGVSVGVEVGFGAVVGVGVSVAMFEPPDVSVIDDVRVMVSAVVIGSVSVSA